MRAIEFDATPEHGMSKHGDGLTVATHAAVSREQSEMQAALALARMRPRDEDRATLAIVKAVERPRLAEDAAYRFPRGSETITGPSIYLAREMARCWGNIRYGLKIIELTDTEVHIRGEAWDAETGAYSFGEDRFARLVQRKVGRGPDRQTAWVVPDERDLRELINRRGALLVRNALLQLIPSWLTDEAMERAGETREKVAAGELAADPEVARRSLLKAFDALGITKEMLEVYLEHPMAQVTAKEVADLRAIGKSIRDGNSRANDYFAPAPAAKADVAKASSAERMDAGLGLGGAEKA